MFDNSIFENWLDKETERIVAKMDKEALRPEEMIVLVLKAQANHFHHLDTDLRKDMQDLRTDMVARFEQVDKRFEQVDKRFERVYSFMQWQTGITIAALVAIFIKLFFR